MRTPLEIPDGPIGDAEALELVERLVADRMAELRARAAAPSPIVLVLVAPAVLVLRSNGAGAA